MSNCKIEYSHDMNELYVTLHMGVPMQHLFFILEFIEKLGYKYWLPATNLREHVFAKVLRDDLIGEST
jgi:hypothetical protein